MPEGIRSPKTQKKKIHSRSIIRSGYKKQHFRHNISNFTNIKANIWDNTSYRRSTGVLLIDVKLIQLEKLSFKFGFKVEAT